MEPLTPFQRAQLAAAARTGGLAFAAWPWMYRASAFGEGRIELPLAGDGLLIAQIDGPLTAESWMAALAYFRGDPQEPTKARWQARQLARELRSNHFAWVYSGRVEGPWGRVKLSTVPARWLDHVALTAGLQTTRWFTTSTKI